MAALSGLVSKFFFAAPPGRGVLPGRPRAGCTRRPPSARAGFPPCPCPRRRRCACRAARRDPRGRPPRGPGTAGLCADWPRRTGGRLRIPRAASMPPLLQGGGGPRVARCVLPGHASPSGLLPAGAPVLACLCSMRRTPHDLDCGVLGGLHDLAGHGPGRRRHAAGVGVCGISQWCPPAAAWPILCLPAAARRGLLVRSCCRRHVRHALCAQPAPAARPWRLGLVDAAGRRRRDACAAAHHVL